MTESEGALTFGGCHEEDESVAGCDSGLHAFNEHGLGVRRELARLAWRRRGHLAGEGPAAEME